MATTIDTATIETALKYGLLTPLRGKGFVVTGTLSMKRHEVARLIHSLGGKVYGTVTAYTNYLLVPDITVASSNKTVKAAQMGIPMLTETQFCEMICPMLLEARNN